MSALAEESLRPGDEARRRAVAFLVYAGGLVVLLLVGLGIWKLMSTPSAPKRQVTRIAILPDTPPPPPPPPKEEKRPEPPKTQQKDIKIEQPKPDMPPQAVEQLKMEGPAGDGPSAFAAGAVNNEYRGGDIGAATPGTGKGSRLQYAFYTNALQKHIQELLARNASVKRLDYRVMVKVWLGADGSIQRAELDSSTGKPDADLALSEALVKLTGFREAPPADMPQPVRLRITNRLTG